MQIFVATHSTTLLSALGQFGKADVNILYLRPEQDCVDGQRYDSISKEIASFLGGHLIMGPLFAAPVVLVEGDDDYRIWVQVARSGKVDICVLPCNGDEIKKYRRTLENMFAALSENEELRGIAILDGDKPKPQVQPNSPQDYVSFVQLQCHESENLYLADEVLKEMGYTWTEAQQKIAREADNFGNKADELKAIGTINRQTADVKKLINEISEILDPKKLLWTVRLGKHLGKDRPTGMLAQFIGCDILDSVWPTSAEQGAPRG